MTLLGVDVGLGACGWAVIGDDASIVDLGVLLQSPDTTVDESTDRARRAANQAELLVDVAQRHGCSAIAAEAMSFGGPPAARFHMAISVGLSWGVVTGVAHTLGLALYSVAPKLWQRAVVPDGPKRLLYAQVEATLTAYAKRHIKAEVSLAMIAKGNRNHALDAGGVGLFVTLRPTQADRIIARRAVA